jgi:hypothetical protein
MDRYPVDDISGKTNCEMHQSMKNISMKVAVGYALPRGMLLQFFLCSFLVLAYDDSVVSIHVLPS